MRKIDIEALRNQLFDKIDTDDLREVEKVERYCALIELVQQCRQRVAEEGASIVIQNGSQRFVKSHPSMADIAKLNTQIISLERSITFKVEDDPPVASDDKSVKSDKRGGLI